MGRPDLRCKAPAVLLHRNDACRSAVTAIVKAVKTVSARSENASCAGTNEREQHLRALADKLLFKVEKSGDRFTLSRTVDVSRPVCHERLSLNEAEELLGTWKLRGLQGG
jgi:hypothetical protein